MIWIWLSCIVLAWINHKWNSKFLRFASVALLALLMSCNNQAVDEINMFNGYFRVVNNPNHTYDIATAVYEGLLVRTAGLLNLTFGQFNFVVLFALLLLINKSLVKMIGNSSIPILIFAATSALLDTTLMKQFIASAFVVYALQFLLSEKPNYRKYLFFTILATSLHMSMAIFVPILLVRVNLTQRQKRRIGLLAGMSIIVLTFLNSQKVIGLDLILSFIQSDRLSVYEGSRGVSFGWLYALAVWFILVFLGNYVEKRARSFVSAEDYGIITRINTILIASLLFVPFSTMTLVFIRLFRPLIWLVGVQIAICLKREYRGKRPRNTRTRIVFTALVLLAGYSIIYNNIIFTYELCIQPVLEGTFFWIE